jgi:hypothetical protein
MSTSDYDDEGPIEEHGRIGGAVSTFASKASEIHALGVGFLSVVALFHDVSAQVAALVFLGVLVTYRDLLSQGHYFALGATTAVILLG